MGREGGREGGKRGAGRYVKGRKCYLFDVELNTQLPH